MGGPIALLKDGDMVSIDAETKELNVENVSSKEWEIRRSKWNPPPLKATKGTLYKFIKNVSSASEGCVTDV